MTKEQATNVIGFSIEQITNGWVIRVRPYGREIYFATLQDLLLHLDILKTELAEHGVK